MPKLVNLGNGTRLILTGVYVNGSPAQLSSLSSVPLGSLVVFQYKRQYLVSISAPGNRTAGWFNERSTIVVDEPPVVNFGNGTRLAEPTLNGVPLPATYAVAGPANLSVSYVKQYLVTYLGPTWLNQTWINAGASAVFSPPQIIDFGNDTRLIHPLVNGTAPPLAVAVDRPLVVVVSYARQYLVALTSPINNTAVWVNASSAVVLSLPPIVDLGNGTRLVDPLVNGRRPPLAVEVDRPMSFVGTYTKQYLVTYLGPTWLNRTWINAGAFMAFNPPQIIDFGNGTRLVNPLVNGVKPPLSISVDKPIGLSVEYTRQYLVSINTPFNNTGVWINAGASYAPPASAISTNGVRLVPAYLTIDGRRAPLPPV
ncbi:MAG: hypothetical protein JZD41_07550, partial [Thermoproteus sp.]|nr:hypothetical protein [Thermoproteus sp.]